MKLSVMICIACFLALKVMVRRVWYREEHLRPGYLRHSLVIHTVDFVATLFLVAVFFITFATHRWVLALLATAGLVTCDLGLREFFLHVEARRMCMQSRHWTLYSAKRRLRDRIKRQSPY